MIKLCFLYQVHKLKWAPTPRNAVFFLFVMGFIERNDYIISSRGGSGEVQLQLVANPSWQARVADCEVLLPRNRSHCWSYVILFCSVDLHAASDLLSVFREILEFRIKKRFDTNWRWNQPVCFPFLSALLAFAFSLLVLLASRSTCTYFKHSPAFCHLLSLFLSVSFFLFPVWTFFSVSLLQLHCQKWSIFIRIVTRYSTIILSRSIPCPNEVRNLHHFSTNCVTFSDFAARYESYKDGYGRSVTEYGQSSPLEFFANALPLLQIMSMDIALAPPPSRARRGNLASRWVPRGHGLPAEALADRPSARPSPPLAWRSLCLCPTLKVCAWPPNSSPINLFNLPFHLTSACPSLTPG